MGTASASPPTFNGNTITATMPIFNAKYYGVKCDGTTDDAAAIQSAISAAASQNGGTILLPAGTCLIDSTVSITTNDIEIVGFGSDGNHDTGTATPATSLKWGGTAGGTLVSCSATAGASNQKITGCSLRGLALLSNSGSAGIGLSIKSEMYGTFTDLYFDQFTSHAVYIGAASSLGEATSSQQNVFRNIVFRNVSNTGDFLYLDITGSGNASMNTFDNTSGVYLNGNGIDLNGADNNVFLNTQFTRGGGGTGIGVDFLGANAYGNSFFRLTPGTGGVNVAANSVNNTIWEYDNSNGSPTPTVASGGQLFYADHRGVLYSVGEAQAVLGQNVNQVNNGRGRITASESLRVVNGSQDHIVLDDNSTTNQWGINIDGSGNFRINRVAGAGVINLGTSAFTTAGIQPNGSTGGYVPESFPLGSATTHPKSLSGTCNAVATTGTVCTFPNSFAFSNTSYTCSVTVLGTTPTSVSYDASVNTTTSIKIYVGSGTPNVAYLCSGS